MSRRAIVLAGVAGAFGMTGLATVLDGGLATAARAARAARSAGEATVPMLDRGMSVGRPVAALPSASVRPTARQAPPTPHPHPSSTPSSTPSAPSSSRPAPQPSGTSGSSLPSAVLARRWSGPIYSIDTFLARIPARVAGNAIMLTIDDGPDPTWTPRYLALLARYQVPATFCMIGRQVGPNASLAREVHAAGHVVANHTWTHDEGLARRAPADIRDEIARTSDAIHAATGAVPTLFRAPGGGWGPAIFDELARQDLLPLGWDVDPRDWARPGVPAISSAMLAAGRHDIILCHDGGGDRSQTYAALQTVIPALQRRGLRFVTLPGT